MKQIIKILNRPFPIIEDPKEKIISAVIFGVFIFLFLLIFQPFGLNNVEGDKLLYFAGFGLITTVVILFNVFVITNLFKEFFSPEKWTVWKGIVQNLTIIIPIALCNWLYFDLVGKPSGIDYSFPRFIFMTVAVGFFPVVFFIYYLEQKLRIKNLILSEKVNRQISSATEPTQKDDELIFKTQSSSIKIKLNNFLCIKSLGNYVTLYFMQENKLKKETIRMTMKKIEEDFSDNKKIIRCHKSYFVNLDKVVTTSGNARALYLHLEELNFPIPVSRSFSKAIISGTI